MTVPWQVISTKLFGALVAVVGASVVSFICLRLLPGDPARLLLGPFAPQDDVDAYSRTLGLDDPVPVQYARYLGDTLTGDFGFSYSTGQPVSEQLTNRLPASLELGLCAFGLAAAAALVLALMVTYRPRPWVDRMLSAVSVVGLGVPAFWLGLVLVLILARGLGILPIPNGQLGTHPPPPDRTGFMLADTLLAGDLAGFGQAVRYLILPTLTLALAPFAVLVRLLRANLREVGREPYLVVGRSKGLDRRRNYRRNALPNALLPTLTVGGLIFGQLLAGSVLVEVVFNWPGVGELVVTSVQRQDYSVLQAFIVLSAVVFVAVNLLVDVLYAVIDPRTRVESSLRRA